MSYHQPFITTTTLWDKFEMKSLRAFTGDELLLFEDFELLELLDDFELYDDDELLIIIFL